MLARPRNHGCVSGTAGDRRHRDHFGRVGEPDQPSLAAAREPEPRRLDLRRGLAREPGRELLLERLEIDAGGAGHGRRRKVDGDQPSAAIFARSSSRLTGLTT